MKTKITNFEDILVWQRARVLVKNIYKTFNNCNDYSFRDQIRRAVLSIMNNIAEGYERRGNKEFRHFLYFKRICWRSAFHALRGYGFRIY